MRARRIFVAFLSFLCLQAWARARKKKNSHAVKFKSSSYDRILWRQACKGKTWQKNNNGYLHVTASSDTRKTPSRITKRMFVGGLELPETNQQAPYFRQCWLLSILLRAPVMQIYQAKPKSPRWKAFRDTSHIQQNGNSLELVKMIMTWSIDGNPQTRLWPSDGKFLNKNVEQHETTLFFVSKLPKQKSKTEAHDMVMFCPRLVWRQRGVAPPPQYCSTVPALQASEPEIRCKALKEPTVLADKILGKWTPLNTMIPFKETTIGVSEKKKVGPREGKKIQLT